MDVLTTNITDLYQNTIELQNEADIINQNISDLNKYVCQLENENGLLKTALTQLNDKINSLYTILKILTATTTTPPTIATTSSTTVMHGHDVTNTANIVNAGASNINANNVLVLNGIGVGFIAIILVCCLICLCFILIKTHKKQERIRKDNTIIEVSIAFDTFIRAMDQYIFNLSVELATVFAFELRAIGLIIALVLLRKKEQTIREYEKYAFLAQEDVKCAVSRL